MHERETNNRTETLKVFVYGTLKIGFRLAPLFDDVRTSVKVGKIRGSLYSLELFPGVVLDEKDEVIGEVHTFSQSSEVIKEVLKRMDNIEGYNPQRNPEDNLYNRKTVLVETDSGTEECFVYEYARSVNNLKRIGNLWQ